MDKLRTIIKGSPFIISFIYIIVGALWIQYSDQAVLSMFGDSNTITTAQSLKGWFYVFVSGLLIYFLVFQSNLMIENLFKNVKKEHYKFEATFENAPVGIAHHEPNEKWILVNKTLCRLLGYSKNELLNLNFEDCIHPDDIEKGRQLDQDIIAGVISSYRMEKRYKRKDGSFFTGKVTKGAVYKESNEVQYLITILEDITQQKKHELQLKQTLEEKEILLSEVHHRVNNNIALISALLELQLMYSSSAMLYKVLEHFKTRLKSISLIYNNFKGVEKEPNINFKWFLEEQISFLNETYNIDETEIDCQLEIEEIELNINQAIPVGLICNEIIIHTIVHQFKNIEHPFIHVRLSHKNKNIIFTVKNNGKPNNDQIDLNDPESLDARIINALVKQIDGEVSLTIDDDLEIYRLVFEKGIWKGSASYNQPNA